MRFRDFTLKKISRQQNRITHGLGKLEVYFEKVIVVLAYGRWHLASDIVGLIFLETNEKLPSSTMTF
jgi:hypothetical protein